MPTKVSQDRRQTIKQAKAAFKARGSVYVSTTERRRLERGAVLHERALRLRHQDQRRKEQCRRREDDETDPKGGQTAKPALLGTQRKLDRFGHASSQYHLGAFFRTSKVESPSKHTKAVEPWEDDETDVDDDTLMDMASRSPDNQVLRARSINLPHKDVLGTSESECKQGLSSTCNNCQGNENNNDENEEDSNARSAATGPTTNFSSFISSDWDWTEEDLACLDKSVQARTQTFSQQASPGPRPSNSEYDNAFHHVAPPVVPGMANSPTVRPKARRASSIIIAGGVSLADLESLAGEDVVLSQQDDT